MSWVEIPQELLDMVIDHLHDDKPSLCACSLVAKSWLSSARYHLFHTICLDHWHNLWPEPSTQVGSLRWFLLEGQTAWPFVQQLRIDFIKFNAASIQPDVKILNPLQLIVQSLPKLHTLIFTRLENISQLFFGDEESAFRHIYEPRIHLRKLVLWDIQKEQLFFWQHLRAFTSIGKLQVLNTTVQSHVNPPSGQDDSNFPRIGSLMGGTDIPFMAMIPPPCVNSLTSLSIHFDILSPRNGDNNTGYMQEIFALAAPNLTFLGIDYSDLSMKPSSRPMDNFHISSCASLREIAFCLYSGTSHSTDESEVCIHWNTFLRLLRQAPVSIQKISIALPLYEPGDDPFNESGKAQFEWDQLDDQLLSFKELGEVRVRTERRLHDSRRWQPSSECQLPVVESWRDVLQQLLPRTQATGRMNFS